MRGKIHSRAPSMTGAKPHVIRAWLGPSGWRGEVFGGGGRLLLDHADPLPTMEAALQAAEAVYRAAVKAGHYLSSGVVREIDDVRVIAEGHPCLARNVVRAVTWVRRDMTPEEMTARFAPGFRVISVDGVEVRT